MASPLIPAHPQQLTRAGAWCEGSPAGSASIKLASTQCPTRNLSAPLCNANTWASPRGAGAASCAAICARLTAPAIGAYSRATVHILVEDSNPDSVVVEERSAVHSDTGAALTVRAACFCIAAAG